MRKVTVLAAFCLINLLSSCNDGDIVYKNIDMDKETRVDRCTNIAPNVFYKLVNTEAMILVANVDDIMKDANTQIQTIELDGTSTSLDYRKYNDKVTNSSICQVPAPAFPTVIQQIPAATGGKVQIRRDVAIDNKTTTIPTGVNTVGLTYQYTFTLFNISFVEGATNIKYDRMAFGTNNYDSRTLGFSFTTTEGEFNPINTCTNSLVALSNKEALILHLDPQDLPKTEGTTIIKLDDTTTLDFKQYYRGGINITEVCNSPGDITSGGTVNQMLEFWNSNLGNVKIVSRLTNPIDGNVQLEHTVTLENVTFYKNAFSNLSFQKPYIPFGTFLSEIN